MSAADLKGLFDRVQSWPKAAQDQLLSMANAIENELRAYQHVASGEELQISEAAIASIDVVRGAGSGADEADVLESMKRLVAEKQRSATESGPDA